MHASILQPDGLFTPRARYTEAVLRSVVIQEHLRPPHLLAPWLFLTLAGWMWFCCTVDRIMRGLSTDPGGWGNLPPESIDGVGWMLAAVAGLGVVWALLVQFRRVDPHGGSGFILCGFGAWVITWVDAMALTFVEAHPYYLTADQFERAQAGLCRGAGYVAYAVGVGLVVGDMVSGWRAKRPEAASSGVAVGTQLPR